MTQKNKKISNVPNLRFPGFEESWHLKKIEALGSFIGGGTPDTSQIDYWSGNIPWISSSDINEGDIHNISKSRFISEESIKESATKIVPKGSVLIVSRVGIGKFAVADEDLCTSQDFTNLITTENEYFICYYFNSRPNLFIKLSQGTSIKGFTTKDIKSAKFFIPHSLEQRKIANFLTTVDKRIQTQSKIIDELKLLKTALSKKIFKQQLRFPEFNKDWKVKKLEEVCEIIGGGTPSTNTKEYWNGNIQWFTPTEIKINFVSKSERTITKLGLKNSSAKILPKGTILLTTRATIGEVAITLEECTTNQGFQSLVVKENYNNVFIFNWIKENKHKLIRMANGSTFPEISRTEIKKIKILIPIPAEQQKIASTLSAIDKKIEIETNLLHQFKTQKNYFLQNLFI